MQIGRGCNDSGTPSEKPDCSPGIALSPLGQHSILYCNLLHALLFSSRPRAFAPQKWCRLHLTRSAANDQATCWRRYHNHDWLIHARHIVRSSALWRRVRAFDNFLYGYINQKVGGLRCTYRTPFGPGSQRTPYKSASSHENRQRNYHANGIAISFGQLGGALGVPIGNAISNVTPFVCTIWWSSSGAFNDKWVGPSSFLSTMVS